MENDSKIENQILLYHPSFEHDSCGVGFVANISGRRNHWILEKAIEAVVNLTHRGAVDADAKTGDGAGILTQVPLTLFQKEVEKLGFQVLDPRDIAVGMIFLPGDNPDLAELCTSMAEALIQKYQIPFFG